METIRSVKVRLEVDTNKRTIVVERDDLRSVLDIAKTLVEASSREMWSTEEVLDEIAALQASD